MVSTGHANTNEKIAKVKSWVPPVHVIWESVHRASALKKKDPKKGLGFFAKSQTKAHILCDELVRGGDKSGGSDAI